MFCMGDAPTLPGINDRFSTPAQLFLMQCKTNRCQFSPAPTLTYTFLLSSFIFSIPLTSFLKTSPSKSFVNRILLPPPRMKVVSCVRKVRKIRKDSVGDSVEDSVGNSGGDFFGDW